MVVTFQEHCLTWLTSVKGYHDLFNTMESTAWTTENPEDPMPLHIGRGTYFVRSGVRLRSEAK